LVFEEVGFDPNEAPQGDSRDEGSGENHQVC
jgi:hypothetical protein